MKISASTLADSGSRLLNGRSVGWLDANLRRGVLNAFSNIEVGGLVIHDQPAGETLKFGNWQATDAATIHILDHRAYRLLALADDIGAGKGWGKSYWDSPDLKTVLEVFVKNQRYLMVAGGLRRRAVLTALRNMHQRRANSVDKAKENIADHYDLGNDFFRHWLDKRMMYSSAVFSEHDADLESAQLEKIDRICRKLRFQPGQHVLEIGSGWGGFAIHAAVNYGVKVTTITLSEEQRQWAIEAAEKAGVADQVQVRLQDYRHVSGQYDAVVSIEMIEAVGDEFLDGYFGKISDCLKPDGQALIQAITVPDQEYELYRRQSDFIRHFIFPGGCLTSVARMQESVTNNTDLQMFHFEEIGAHYARTLLIWHQMLLSNREQLPLANQDNWFFRLWQFYLLSCAVLFEERQIGTAQLLYRKPFAKQEPILVP